jgi:phosphate transport system protein
MDRIRGKITEMARLAEKALHDSLQALADNNHQQAYGIILRDQYIDELEKEIDRLCLEFIVRQQPVGAHLRFTYSVIKINTDLERIGDYAESIARQVLRFDTALPDFLKERVARLADLSLPMLHNAVQAFIQEDVELARKTIEVEDTVDAIRASVIAELVGLHQSQTIPYEVLDPLATIVRRLERVSDQARDICMEAHYVTTGEYTKHPGADVFRILFVDRYNSCRSRMAEAIAQAMDLPNFIFSSAGLEPRPIDPATMQFMSAKGYELAPTAPRAVYQVPNLDHYQVIVTLDPEARKAFPENPYKVIYLNWSVVDPSKKSLPPEKVQAVYEKTFQFIQNHVRDLVQAILGQSNSAAEMEKGKNHETR